MFCDKVSFNIDMHKPWEQACELLDASRYRRCPVFDEGSWSSPEELATGLKKAGFEGVSCFAERVQLEVQSPDDYVEYWMTGKHPTFQKLLDAWDGDPEEVRPSFEKVMREKYPDPRVIGGWAGVAIGRKPS
jgi:hypothetical protein